MGIGSLNTLKMKCVISLPKGIPKLFGQPFELKYKYK